MPPPTSLAIKTSAVLRLTKEESSYHKEITQQTARLERMEADGNADEYEVRQQQTVVKQTKDVLPAVHEKLAAAVEVLETELEDADEAEPEENKNKAKEALAAAKKVLEEASDKK